VKRGKNAACFLTVDIGTTAMKLGLFTAGGTRAECSIQEYTPASPHPGWQQMDEKAYVKAFTRGIKELKEKAGSLKRRLSAISFCSQGQAFFPLDRRGNALHPAIVWLDTRARQEAACLAKAFSREELYKRTGMNDVFPGLTPCTILWLRRNRPDVFKKTSRYLLLKDYFIYRLTGKSVGDTVLLPSSGMFELKKKRFWKEMLDFLEIREEQLPEIVEPWDVVGRVTDEAAHRFGLPAGTPVVAGGWDQSLSALGAGNFKEGVVTVNIGTCLSLYTTTRTLTFDPRCRLLSGRHVVRDRFFLLPFVQTAGIVLKWFRERFTPGLTYEKLTEMAESVGAGADGLIVLPHLAGASCPHSNPDARGVLHGLNLTHGEAHVVRAIMESVAFAMLENIEVLESLGIRASKIIAIGGGSRSRLWLQMLADAANVKVVKPEVEESALLGGAVLSATSLGIKKDISSAVRDFCRIKETIAPDAANNRIYRASYGKYTELYRTLFGG
jgi:xylulokinase